MMGRDELGLATVAGGRCAVVAAACRRRARRRAATTRPAPATVPGRRPDRHAQNGPLGGCPVFPADNAWNTDVSTLPGERELRRTTSPTSCSSGNQNLHADFGGGGEYGIPYVTVRAGSRRSRSTSPPTATRATRARTRSRSARRSRAAPSDGDRHVLAVDRDHCKLYELYRAFPQGTTTGTPTPARCSTSARTRCARSAGRRPTPPGCRSSPASSATTRWRRARSTTRCASRSRGPRRATCSRRRTTRRRAPTPTCPPMGLRLRLKASFDIVALHGRGAGDPRGAEEVRDDRRRQR